LHERDELAQLVMIRIWKGYQRFDGRCALSTWLYQVVRNTAATEHRRRGARPVPTDSTVLVPAVPTAPAPEEALVERDRIERALDAVAQPFRATVELVDVWGCRPGEIAAMAGITEATVRTRLWRGRQSARQALAELPT
jgi:RNA polymerase sigma-70 factor (ECF subfamily)